MFDEPILCNPSHEIHLTIGVKYSTLLTHLILRSESVGLQIYILERCLQSTWRDLNVQRSGRSKGTMRTYTDWPN